MNDWHFLLGDHDPKTLESGQKTMRMKKVVLHPQYNSNGHINDIALVELSQPSPVLIEIHPVCLPDNSEVFPVGQNCYTTGWGHNSSECFHVSHI